MKSSTSIVATLLLTLLLCPQPDLMAQTKKNAVKAAETVTVYYFHGARRCKTCLAIEKVAKSTVEEKYSGNSQVRFLSVDFEAEENEALAEKYEVAGSSLVVAGGTTHSNLTAEAFQYARSDPDKLKTKVVAAVDKALK